MRVIFVGMKGCGKTTIGRLLAKKMQVAFIDADAYIEKTYAQESGKELPFREIFKQYGDEHFHVLDTQALRNIAKEFARRDFVFACGGRTPLLAENQEILARLGTIIFLEVEKGVLLKRILAQGIPAFFPYQDDPARSLDELLTERAPVYKSIADITIDSSNGTAEETVTTILTELRSYGKN